MCARKFMFGDKSTVHAKNVNKKNYLFVHFTLYTPFKICTFFLRE